MLIRKSIIILILPVAVSMLQAFGTSYSKLDDHKAGELLPACFIYGYVENYVVAEIENAVTNELAYSSFEDNTDGNWTRNAAGIQSVAGKKALTGTKYYSLSSGAVTKTFSPAPGKNMIVSYWSRSGAQVVNGSSTASAGRTVTIDGFTWTFYEHVLTTPASISISVTGIIHELRLLPHDAKKTT